MNTVKKKDLTALADEELALELRSGNKAAFDEIVRRHQQQIYSVAYRMMLNREDALDVVQEALLKAYRKINTWKPTGMFVPWLIRLTVNHSIDVLRKNKRRRRARPFDSDRDPALLIGAQKSNIGTEETVRAGEIEARVKDALEVLSPRQRTVFVLRHFEGLQLAEIAPVIGCTVGSVKVHLFRALKKMQGQLADLRE